MLRTVVVFTAAEPGSHWAHAINSIKLADGFAKSGCTVHLVTRPGIDGFNTIDDLNRAYGTDRSIQWHPIPFRTFGIPFHKLQRQFARKATNFIKKLSPDLVYGRDYFVPIMCAEAGICAVAESHAAIGFTSSAFKYMTDGTKKRHFKVLTTIGENLADYYYQCGVPRKKLTVLPDCVDIDLFTRDNKLDSQSPFPTDKKIVLYAGHLYDYKGIPTVLEAAKSLPQLEFHLLGGHTIDIERQRDAVAKTGIENVVIHGLVSHAKVPLYLWHADVLLLPPSAKHPSAAWTSPVKLAEYLASGVPTIASDIPALKYWLSSQEVFFFNADSATDLAQKIEQVLSSPDYASKIAQAAYEMATKLTYQRKAERLMEIAFADP